MTIWKNSLMKLKAIWNIPQYSKQLPLYLALKNLQTYQSHSNLSRIQFNIVNFKFANSLLNSAKYSTSSSDHPGRHKYHKETEDGVNEQILAEFEAAYSYLSMACYYGRTEVALPGCHGFFMNMYEEELQHALVFVNYQSMRGGCVQLCPISVPQGKNWECVAATFATAVEMEKTIKEKLVTLNDIAEKHHDLSLVDLITNDFINEQDRSICELARLLTRATKMGNTGLAEYLFDKELHEGFVIKSAKKSKDNDIDKTYK